MVRVTGNGSKNGRKNADFRKDLAMSDNECPIIQHKFVEGLTFGCPLVLQVHRSSSKKKMKIFFFQKSCIFLKFFNFTRAGDADRTKIMLCSNDRCCVRLMLYYWYGLLIAYWY